MLRIGVPQAFHVARMYRFSWESCEYVFMVWILFFAENGSFQSCGSPFQRSRIRTYYKNPSRLTKFST